MTIRYVGSGGSNSNDGLSWANRKLTLTGVEDTPIVAGDTVYVGPGIYREQLTMDVTGTAGNIITYIADTSGINTDGIGGIVRITGSDDDKTNARTSCIYAPSTMNYRTWRGFLLDNGTVTIRFGGAADNNIIEDCVIAGFSTTVYEGIYFMSTPSNNIIRRCMILGGNYSANCYGIWFQHASAYNGTNTVENCIIQNFVRGVYNYYVGNTTINSCLLLNCNIAFYNDTVGTTNKTKVYNSIICGMDNYAFYATPSESSYTENYNTLWGNVNNRSSGVAAGANDNSYPPLFMPKILVDGFNFPWNPYALSPHSPIRAITGTSELTEDLFGMTRPTTSGKKSRGPIQFSDTLRETTTYRTTATSIKFEDAGRKQIIVPCTATSTIVSVYCYRESNYSGTLPQMIIKQPGQSDRTTVDTGSASTWNQLTDTFTPAASPSFFIVELVSNNTNTANATTNDVFFDDISVSVTPSPGTFETYIFDKPFDTQVPAIDLGGFEYWITDRMFFDAYLKVNPSASSSISAYINGDAQTITPDSDVTAGSWKNEASGTTLYPSVSDSSDSTYAWYNHAVVGDYFEVGLSNPTGSPPFAGAHTLVWRAYKIAGTQTTTLKCELRQGSSTSIASDTQTITGSVAGFTRALSLTEISNITDFNDLRVRITIMSVT